jgi:thiol-disulfide isomerase/thioredoxin
VEVLLRGGGRSVQSLRAGEGYLAQSSAWLHFGMGDAEVERARVRWPGGAVEEFSGLVAGGRFRLVEGTGQAQRAGPEAGAALSTALQGPASPAGVPPPAGGRTRVVLAASFPMPSIAFRAAPGAEEERLFGLPATAGARAPGRPVLVNLFASWCAPCAVELRELAADAPLFAERGLALFALSADEPERAGEALALLERLGWPGSRGLAAGDAVDVLDTLQGALLGRETRIGVPTSWLVDGEGRLVALYGGPVDPQEVLADLELLGLSPAERRDAAVPFPGTWRGAPAPADLAGLARRFEARGLDRAALELRRLGFEVAERPSAALGRASSRGDSRRP